MILVPCSYFGGSTSGTCGSPVSHNIVGVGKLTNNQLQMERQVGYANENMTMNRLTAMRDDAPVMQQ